MRRGSGSSSSGSGSAACAAISDGSRTALVESTSSMSIEPNIDMMSSSWSRVTRSEGRASFTSS
jgi:hypothetical protein